eukprot:TRINITY_DN10900_c0_g1_i2.p1 TRINITY_DN10900_c0_g1~~TRINITY_DN10900_c0_g1_i2.p1  ORF type:complete len:1010 (+),score=138.51 TRINITY_DN10900_c0_g1_i2:225-3032(+)
MLVLLLEFVMLRKLDTERFSRLPLRLVMLSGDFIPLSLPQTLQHLLPNVTLYSLGGATEVSIWSCWYGPLQGASMPKSWTSIPYGFPLTNQSMYVLTDDLTLTPSVCVGEICFSGTGVARGYWKNAEKTNKAFKWSPWLEDRVYKTGDLGRYMPDNGLPWPCNTKGAIQILGRKDFQVKINGFRVELEEIQMVMASRPEVKDALVLPLATSDGRQTLVGFVQAADGIVLEEEANSIQASVRRDCQDKLPEYMVPSKVHALHSWPVSANGKFDREKLAEIHRSQRNHSASQPEDQFKRGRELKQVESVLEAHPQVIQARAHVHDGKLFVFIVPRTSDNYPDDTTQASQSDGDKLPEVNGEAEIVALWHDVYNQLYHKSGESEEWEPTVDAETDFSGWTSSADGQYLGTDAMQEWLTNTVDSIRLLRGSRLLEVGVGTGLLFWRLLPYYERYWATDLSDTVVGRLKFQLDSHNIAQCQDVKLLVQAAHEPPPAADMPFDTVVMNSVAHYFPSEAYFLQVLRLLIAASTAEIGGKRLFIGDLRSNMHQELFHLWIQLGGGSLLAGPSSFAYPSASLLRHRVDIACTEEGQLCVDPAIFLQLELGMQCNEQRLHLEYTRIMVKTGNHDNELNAFRYDVIMFVGDKASLPPTAASQLTIELAWKSLDGGSSIDNLRHALCQALDASYQYIIVRDVPNLLLNRMNALLGYLQHTLDDDATAELAGEAAAAAEAASSAMFGEGHAFRSTAAAMRWLGDQLELAVEVTWGRAIDEVHVLFAKGYSGKLIPHVPCFHGIHAATSVRNASMPMFPDVARRLLPALDRYCEEMLAPNLHPSVFFALPEIPLKPNSAEDAEVLTRYAEHSATCGTTHTCHIRRQKKHKQTNRASPDIGKQAKRQSHSMQISVSEHRRLLGFLHTLVMDVLGREVGDEEPLRDCGMNS